MGFMQKNRGVITIMLTIILVPVLACSSILVELCRYRSYKNLYNEISELSALSALANFDSKLYSQYGLLGMSENQADSVNSCVQSNLNTDLGAFQRLAAPSSVSVSTDMLYSLANTQVLKRQILEAEKIHAPLSLATGILSGGNYTLESLLGELKKSMEKAVPGSEVLKNYSKAADKLGDVANSGLAVVEGLDTWDQAINNYTSSYQAFSDKLNAYNEAKSAYEDSVDEEGNGDDGLKNTMDAAQTELTAAKSDYLEKITALQTSTDTFFKSLDQFVSDAVTYKSTVDTQGYDAEKKEKEEAIDKWLESSNKEADEATDLTAEEKEKLKNSNKKRADELKEEAKKENTTLKSAEQAVANLANDLSDFNYTVNMDIVNSNITDLKARVDAGEDCCYTIMQITGRDIGKLRDSLKIWENACDEKIADNIIEYITQLFNVFKLFYSAMHGYELDCNSVIANMSSLPSETGAGGADTFIAGDDAYVTGVLNEMSSMASELGYDMSDLYPASHVADADYHGYIEGLITSVQNDITIIFGALNKITEVLSGNIWEIIAAVKEVANAFEAAADLVVVIPKLVKNIGEVANYIVSSLYEGALIQEYAFQRFTTRMDYKASSGTIEGTIESLFGSGSSTKFVIAEVEYVANGSPSERVNQEKIFWFIFILRLALNIPAVLTNSFVGEVAAATGPFAVLVYLAWDVAESYIDTALLTETETKIPLVKSSILLDPSGLTALGTALGKKIADFNAIGMKPAEVVDTIESSISGAMDKVYEKGMFKMNYENLLWIRLCFVGNEKKLRRIADLIQMNMQQGNEKFLLANTYTYLRVKMDGEYNTIMPTFNFVNGGKITTLRYAGY